MSADRSRALSAGSPLVHRMRHFGTTIFAEMSALALRTDAINLGQGFPDTDGPQEVLDAAKRAIDDGHNQYPPGRGIPELRQALVEHQQRYYDLSYDPDTEILVTAGATEAMAATLLALCETGDEVLVLEPTYDAYMASAAMAGAVIRPVRLEYPDYHLDPELLAASVTDRTRLLIINSPHNPTGHVLSEQECRQIARIAMENDLIVVCDEVYEHLVFDGGRHLPLATFPGMRERTVQIGSAGKTFAVTGWKIGWICAAPSLIDAIITTKQFITFVNGSAFQYGVAAGLALPAARIAEIRDTLQAGRDHLTEGLRAAGFTVRPSEATYFLTVDIADIGERDSLEFCRALPERCGVAAVPSQAFYAEPAGVETLVRFAFSKRPEVLRQAAERLAGLS